ITQMAQGGYQASATLEVDFALVLSHVIDSAKQNPAELRNAIYETARFKLQQEVGSNNPPLEDSEIQRLTAALETAIERVEAMSLRQEELRKLKWLDGLIQDLSKAPSPAPLQKAMRVINKDSVIEGDNS